jgi:hypothetical protein
VGEGIIQGGWTLRLRGFLSEISSSYGESLLNNPRGTITIEAECKDGSWGSNCIFYQVALWASQLKLHLVENYPSFQGGGSLKTRAES